MPKNADKKCEDCGDVIPKMRVKILPDCKYCVKCAEKRPLEIEYNIDDLYDASELGDIVSGED